MYLVEIRRVYFNNFFNLVNYMKLNITKIITSIMLLIMAVGSGAGIISATALPIDDAPLMPAPIISKFKTLTSAQRQELADLKESGDIRAIMDKLNEFGITINSKRGEVANIMSRLTEAQKAELKALRASGNIEAFRTKMAEYGVMMKGKFVKHIEKRAEIEKAIITGDYELYLSLVKDTQIAGMITDEMFNKLHDAYNLRADGMFEEARVLFSDIKDQIPTPRKGFFWFLKNDRRGNINNAPIGNIDSNDDNDAGVKNLKAEKLERRGFFKWLFGIR